MSRIVDIFSPHFRPKIWTLFWPIFYPLFAPHFGPKKRPHFSSFFAPKMTPKKGPKKWPKKAPKTAPKSDIFDVFPEWPKNVKKRGFFHPRNKGNPRESGHGFASFHITFCPKMSTFWPPFSGKIPLFWVPKTGKSDFVAFSALFSDPILKGFCLKIGPQIWAKNGGCPHFAKSAFWETS